MNTIEAPHRRHRAAPMMMTVSGRQAHPPLFVHCGDSGMYGTASVDIPLGAPSNAAQRPAHQHPVSLMSSHADSSGLPLAFYEGRNEPNPAKGIHYGRQAANPSPPKGTGPSGRALWRDVLSKYELEQHETALLIEACRTVDQLDALHEIATREGLIVQGPHGSKPNPALVEARQLRIALARLTASLRLPAGDADTDPAAGRRPQRRVGARGVYALPTVV
jgi:hypothetical protein